MDELRRHETRLSQHLGALLQRLRTQVEARPTTSPQYVMDVDHRASRGPLEHANIRAGAENQNYDSLEDELQTHRTIPSQKKDIC